jgi:hypothetical protein
LHPLARLRRSSGWRSTQSFRRQRSFSHRAGALKRDSGTVGEGKTLSERNRITTGFWRFTGKRGDLVFRERGEWVDLGSDVNRDGFRDVVAFGTWKAVRGTGQYAGVAGGGRSVHLGLGRKWVARFEGFLTSP